jgi:hypothetical protein
LRNAASGNRRCRFRAARRRGHLHEAHAQERDVRVRALAPRLGTAPPPFLAARLPRADVSEPRSRLSTMASIMAATFRAFLWESPISRAVSSNDGARAVINTLRDMASRYVGGRDCVNRTSGSRVFAQVQHRSRHFDRLHGLADPLLLLARACGPEYNDRRQCRPAAVSREILGRPRKTVSVASAGIRGTRVQIPSGIRAAVSRR